MQRRLLVSMSVGATVLAATVGWVAGRSIQSPAQIAAKTAPPVPSLISVSIEKRQLSSEVIVRGVARYGGVRSVSIVPSALKSSPAILTVAPVVGSTLTEGKSAMSISGRPVFVLQGNIPVYRDLVPGTVGDDVRQLQASLARLGFNPGPVNGRYGVRTAAAVARFYSASGYTPFGPTPSQLKALRSAGNTVSQARLSVFKADAAVAKASASSSTSPQSLALLRQEDALARSDLADAERALADLKSATGISVPSDEVLFFPVLPLRVESVKLRTGDDVSGSVMKISTPRLAVDSSLSLKDATLVHAGMPATIDDSNLGITVHGRVSLVASGPGTNGVDPQHVYMEVLPDQDPPQLVGASVKVTIAVSSTNGKVLVVPASALFLGGDGRTRIQLYHLPAPIPVVVRPGLSAGGLVAITPVGHSLAPGDRVVVGRG